MLVGSHGFVIYSNRIKPEANSEPIIIDERERSRIVKNIRKAFAYMGFDIETA